MINQPESTSTSGNSGRDLVQELGRRRMLGSYFGFRGYVRLRQITTPDALRNFLNEQGFPKAPVENGAIVVADFLATSQAARHRTAYTAWAIIEALFWVLGFLSL
jgi:hypothetical protein